MPNGLAFVPAGCDVFSESLMGGEYLRITRTDGILLTGDRPFNNRIDQQAIHLALRMRGALLRACVEADWETWALALAQQAPGEPALSISIGRAACREKGCQYVWSSGGG